MRSVKRSIDERPYVEHFDGEARVKVPPSQHHGLVGAPFVGILRRCSGERGFVETEPHMRIGALDGTDTVFVPDIAYISKERLRSSYPGGNVVPEFAPDIAVEVRSPDVSAPDLERKIAKYLACGTVLVLDVDPELRTIHAHAAGGDLRSFRSGDTFTHPAVPWLEFEVAEIFADLDRFEALTSRK